MSDFSDIIAEFLVEHECRSCHGKASWRLHFGCASCNLYKTYKFCDVDIKPVVFDGAFYSTDGHKETCHPANNREVRLLWEEKL